jgi:hypothetical protein
MARITEDHLEQQCLDQVILFQAADGQVTLDVRLEADTVWLSQAQMAELFGRERSVISRHVGNVFKEGELPEKSNVHFLHIAGADRPLPRHPDKLVGNWLKLPHAPRHAIRRRV